MSARSVLGNDLTSLNLDKTVLYYTIYEIILGEGHG